MIKNIILKQKESIKLLNECKIKILKQDLQQKHVSDEKVINEALKKFLKGD